MSILERLSAGIVTRSPEESALVAAELAAVLPDEATLALEGDLGAGKTTFVKGLARAWGVRETVSSPTFNIYNLYRGARLLAHMDAYRLDPATAIWDELMLEDFIQPPFCLAIEWPGNLGSIPWPITHRLEFTVEGAKRRLIRLR